MIRLRLAESSGDADTPTVRGPGNPCEGERRNVIERVREAATSLRVLVAEDEYMNKLLLEEMLEELGARIVGSVGSVDEIVPAAERGGPEVAILDVNLRGRLVYDAASRLRQRGTPFVFVSGYDTLVDSPPELEAAPRLRKPFRLEDLAAALAEAVADRDAS